MSWRSTAQKRKPGNRSGGGKEAVLKRKQNLAAASNVKAENAHTKMPNFVKFYKVLAYVLGAQKNRLNETVLLNTHSICFDLEEVIPAEEWKEFLDGVLSKIPLTFRIPRTHRLCSNLLEAKKGSVSQSDVLVERMKTDILPDIMEQKLSEVPCELNCLEWYPNEHAWQANFDIDALRASSDMNKFLNFLIEETSGFNILRQDIHSMIPPLLLDVLPHHKVLDMFASPGWMAAQLSEDMYANPKGMPTGFLITNDTDSTKLQWRWIQGTNMMYLHHDSRYLPWLYSSHEHTPENRILFDKILCDVPCSEDGQLGREAAKRTSWKLNDAYTNHKNQKRFLQRGIELLAEGGDLVYTSTSMNPIENEAVVAAILRMAPGVIQLKDIREDLPGFVSREGLSKWKVMTEAGKFYDNIIEAPEIFKKMYEDSIFPPTKEEVQIICLDKCMRVYPYDNDSAGFFCALLTRTGKLPWVSQVSESDSLPIEVEDEHYKPPKAQFVKPFKYVFDVTVKEIEWSTHKTNTKLQTTTTTNVESFDSPYPKVMQSCMKLVKDETNKTRNHFMAVDDESWLTIKNFYGLTADIDPKLTFMRGTVDSYHLYYHHPIIKQLFKANKNVHADQKLRNSGLKVFRCVKPNTEMPDCNFILSELGISMILPYMKKRIVKVSSEDLQELLVKRQIPTSEISDALKAALPKETGCTVFHYIPKGKNAEPSCEIVLVGWLGKDYVKNCTDQSIDWVHYMRLCGIENPNKQRKEETPKVKTEVKTEGQ